MLLAINLADLQDVDGRQVAAVKNRESLLVLESRQVVKVSFAVIASVSGKRHVVLALEDMDPRLLVFDGADFGFEGV